MPKKRLRIGKNWLRWDEEEEVLKNEKEEVRAEEAGKGEEGSEEEVD